MEGPSVHIVAEKLSFFSEQTINSVSGGSDQLISDLTGQRIMDVRAVKKRLFLDCEAHHVIIHFLMYGSYLVNESRDRDEVLSLSCSTDTLNIYGSSVKVVEPDSSELAEYDRPEEDVLSPEFDGEEARHTLESSDRTISDVLLDQEVFGGVGNTIKNEVLWALRIHPTSTASELSPGLIADLIDETIAWTHHWYDCKKEDESPGLQAYQQESCSRCGHELLKEDVGRTGRPTYWCPDCQELEG